MEWTLYVVFGSSLLAMMFFSGIEMAFFSASRLNVELKRKQGSSRGKIIGKFVDQPALFLGTTITGYIIALTIFVLQTSEVLKPVWNWLQIHSRGLQVTLEIVFNVIIIVVFVELLPRAFFRAHSNTLLHGFAYTTNFFSSIFSYLVNGLFALSYWILKYVFAVRVDKNKTPFSRRDLRLLFSDTNNHSSDETTSTRLLENAQELPNVRLRQCLVPRKEIIGMDIKSSIAAVVDKIVETKRSRIIIYDGSIDNIIGYVHELDLFKKPTDIPSILIDIIAVPESMSAVDLINKFSKEAKSIAWVVDEFGGTAGIVTMEDVLEELFGEILDEYDVERFIEKQLSEDEYLFSGRLELDYLTNKYNFEFEADEDSETISGYIINYHETIPAQKERIIIGDYEFDIVTVSDTRIETLKLKKLK